MGDGKRLLLHRYTSGGLKMVVNLIDETDCFDGNKLRRVRAFMDRNLQVADLSTTNKYAAAVDGTMCLCIAVAYRLFLSDGNIIYVGRM